MKAMRFLPFIFTLCLLFSGGMDASAQFWKKKKYYSSASSGKITQPDGDDYRDAFVRESNKGPNIKTSSKPFFRTKKKMHRHTISRKTKKPGRQKFFKPRYNKALFDNKSKDNFSRNARKTKKDAQKGGGGSNGIFRGRKK